MKTRGFEVVSKYQGRGIELPQRKTAASAGYDLQAARTVVIEPGQMAMVPTGLKAYMQSDEVLTIHIRSSLAVRGGVSFCLVGAGSGAPDKILAKCHISSP